MALIAGPRETLATLSSSKGITSTILVPTSGTFTGKHCELIVVQPKTQAVYIMWDGTDATNAGLALAVGSVFELAGKENCANFRVLEQAASATLLVVPHYRV
jgi:hypothetical protein